MHYHPEFKDLVFLDDGQMARVIMPHVCQDGVVRYSAAPGVMKTKEELYCSKPHAKVKTDAELLAIGERLRSGGNIKQIAAETGFSVTTLQSMKYGAYARLNRLINQRDADQIQPIQPDGRALG